jgi:hypothetical protein
MVTGNVMVKVSIAPLAGKDLVHTVPWYFTIREALLKEVLLKSKVRVLIFADNVLK